MEELLTKVQSAFNSAFDIDPHAITIDTSPDDVPNWDSMGHVTLASSLERAFGLTFDVDEFNGNGKREGDLQDRAIQTR